MKSPCAIIHLLRQIEIRTLKIGILKVVEQIGIQINSVVTQNIRESNLRSSLEAEKLAIIEQINEL